MNIIDLATKTLQLAIQTAVAGVKTVVDAIKTTADATKTKVDTLDTRTTTINTNVNTINTNIGTPASAANNALSANTHSKLNWLTTNVGTLVNGRVIKSVQTGMLNLMSNNPNATITISAVDKSKTIVFASSSAQTKAGVGVSGVNAALASANNTTLSITAVMPVEYPISLPVQWQVIEFY